jgi:hypothetical protein
VRGIKLNQVNISSIRWSGQSTPYLRSYTGTPPPFFPTGKKVQATWTFVHFPAGVVAPPLYHQIMYNTPKNNKYESRNKERA